MTVKKYRQSTVRDALREIREELGPEALVLNTEMVAAMKPEALAKVVATIPVGRLGECEEISRCVLFLVEDPGFINGSTLTVNGSQYIAG